MQQKSFGLRRALLVTALVGGLMGLVPGTALADDPVSVTFEVTGTPGFDASVTVKATVTSNDGSTVESLSWSQVGGATAVLADTTTDTVTVTFASRDAYRDYMIHVLQEPPIAEEQFPPNVPVPEGEFHGGLRERFQVVGASPFALEHVGMVALEFEVVTSSGTYHAEEELHLTLPWRPAGAIRNVPVGIPVVVHGKEQVSYDWKLTAPEASGASLMGGTSQSPEFTPDAPGRYQVTVTDQATSQAVTLNVEAGLWRGMITGQDASGRPKPDTACTGCHAPNTPLDKFTPWKATGHAEILSSQLDTSTHYGPNCFACHSVGFDTSASNGGFDDAADYQAFIDSGMINNPGDNWTTMLAQFPAAAKLANIQCENCHGPQQSAAHYQGQGARETLSSDMCGVCHGEPARHGRFQQWQLSGHANYELAVDEGDSGSCSRCHTGNGFLAWEDAGFSSSSVTVTWTQDEVHPQTCQTCHDPHAIGTTSGGPSTNATVRVSGDTPMLLAGFQAKDVGRGAICMTCHNGRRGLRNDSTFDPSDAARAPHSGPQADFIMGQNLYLVDVGDRSYHSMVEDSCVTCHMEATPPPPDLSYNQGGTNHTFYARNDICADCHTNIKAEDVQGPVHEKLEELKHEIEAAILDVMTIQLAAGNTIKLTDGDDNVTTITSAAQISDLEFTESHGRQAINVQLANGTEVEHVRMNDVEVVMPSGSKADLYDFADQAVPKAGWNLALLEADGSMGVHNPTLAKRALDVSLYAVKNATHPGTEGGDPGIGGGPGNGAGAVACTTPYVYWAEIAANLSGDAGSQWRTDIVARNLASTAASLKLILHTDNNMYEAMGTIPGGAQGAFEDLVGQLGVTGKGSVEVCSDQPLLVAGRIFNQAATGTFGQFLDGHVANLGMSTGDIATLLGLRQKTDEWRTNISVTNGGMQDATVAITLYDNAGTALHSYQLTVKAGKVVQDTKPFESRAKAPDLGWGFATVEVVSGSNIRSSASVIDMKTNDPVTIPAKM